MNTTSIGVKAEEKASQHLQNNGYQIIDRNWRTKTCEIDIIAVKDRVIYFIEVKFRSTAAQGSGFEYIRWAKLRQMEYAARLWIAKNRWKYSYCLSAASVIGNDYKVTFIEQLQSN